MDRQHYWVFTACSLVVTITTKPGSIGLIRVACLHFISKTNMKLERPLVFIQIFRFGTKTAKQCISERLKLIFNYSKYKEI